MMVHCACSYIQNYSSHGTFDSSEEQIPHLEAAMALYWELKYSAAGGCFPSRSPGQTLCIYQISVNSAA